jgi:hypothetical protein
MNKKMILLFLMTVWVVVSCSRGSAQEGVVTYLEERFKQKNIPITEITVLQETPLRLQIVVQGSSQGVTTDDMVMLKSIDREVFIFARQQGYLVESYISILNDNQGNQLDWTKQYADLDKITALNMSHATLSDEVVQKIVSGRIHPYLKEYNLDDKNIIINISSEEGLQTLTFQLETASLEEADTAAFFFWTLSHFPLFSEINEQGAQIVWYRAKITNENGENLFDYFYDFQLDSGGWTQAERLQSPNGEGPGSIDLSVETPINTGPTVIEIITALPLTTEAPLPTVTSTEFLTETPTELPTQTPTPAETTSPTP